VGHQLAAVLMLSASAIRRSSRRTASGGRAALGRGRNLQDTCGRRRLCAQGAGPLTPDVADRIVVELAKLFPGAWIANDFAGA